MTIDFGETHQRPLDYQSAANWTCIVLSMFIFDCLPISYVQISSVLSARANRLVTASLFWSCLSFALCDPRDLRLTIYRYCLSDQQLSTSVWQFPRTNTTCFKHKRRQNWFVLSGSTVVIYLSIDPTIFCVLSSASQCPVLVSTVH